MDVALQQKNDFVVSLRTHLQSLYLTEPHYTYGDSDFEGKKIGGAYCSVLRDPNIPRDISGFCFRKDLCSFPPRSELEVLSGIKEYAESNSIECVFKESRERLLIKINNRDYLVHAYIGGGYAGEISVYFSGLPFFEKVN